MEQMVTQYWPVLVSVVLVAVAWGHLRTRVNILDRDLSAFKSEQRSRDDKQDTKQDETNGRIDSMGKEMNRRFEKQDDNMSTMSTTLATIDANVKNLVGWMKNRIDNEAKK